jgi:hypothetical protein
MIVADRVAAAQHLEGVEPEPVALILDVDARHAEGLAARPGQVGQRRDAEYSGKLLWNARAFAAPAGPKRSAEYSPGPVFRA